MARRSKQVANRLKAANCVVETLLSGWKNTQYCAAWMTTDNFYLAM